MVEEKISKVTENFVDVARRKLKQDAEEIVFKNIIPKEDIGDYIVSGIDGHLTQ